MSRQKDRGKPAGPSTRNEPHYTIFVRLPFARNDFIDPPQISWSTQKDDELWDTISRTSTGQQIDWEALAQRYNVTLPFLLQKAAWLYDRQMSSVRAHLRKVSKPSSVGGSPAPGGIDGGSGISGGQPMSRGGSNDSRNQRSSSQRYKERPGSRGEASVPGQEALNRVKEPRLQRNLSTSTVLQVRHPSSSLKTRPSPPASTATHRLSRDLDPRSLDASPTIRQTPLVKHTSAEQDSAISSSSDSDLAPPPPSRAQQQQQHQQHRPRTYSRQSYTNPATRRVSQAAPVNDAEGSEDSSPPFLPFSNNDVDAPKRTLEPNISDPSATLRITSHPQQSKAKAKPNAQAPNPKHLPQNLSQKRTSPSLTSSSSAQSHPTRPPTHQPALSSLSPKKHRRHLQGRHPLQSNSQNKTTSTTSGSEPNSGIGSSFSDLDDADEDDDVDDDFSGTQSALEEALAGEMERGVGGLSSRLGGMSLVGRGQGRGR